MKSARAVAAGYVAFVFGAVSYIMIVIERGMGFLTPADYFDPVKVAAGYDSVAWLVCTLLYLTLPIALYVLAKSSVQQRAAQFGLAATALGLVLGCLDLIGIQLSSMLPGEAEIRTAVAALLPIRYAVLKATVIALGLFAWGTTRPEEGRGGRTWRGLGWFVLAVSVLFLFVFVPVPIAIFLWAVGLTVTSALHGGDVSKPRASAFPAPGPSQPVA